MTRLADVEAGFTAAGVPPALTKELLDAFTEAKQRFYRNDLRPQAVEGGRFTEAAFRILEWQTTGAFTPIGKTLPSVDKMLITLQNATGNESTRLHIPRTLRLIYDVRNKRDTAHLADGIDPNLQDASLVIHNMDWVLAELVRQFHSVTADRAQAIIVDLVSRAVPVIQELDGFPVILKKLKASDHVLVLLYWRGAEGITFGELSDWVLPPMRANLRRTVTSLKRQLRIHFHGQQLTANTKITILRPGEDLVVARKLVEPA
ncbi:hypothetical protein [Kribbella sp. NPDC004875]|uniref:hypothetical protein n=1 Tax=Kribbella sp. NPDC004875 TaxID=3364107 RepID=UPI0036A12E9B